MGGEFSMYGGNKIFIQHVGSNICDRRPLETKGPRLFNETVSSVKVISHRMA
jgi:hypothetical protein